MLTSGFVEAICDDHQASKTNSGEEKLMLLHPQDLKAGQDTACSTSKEYVTRSDWLDLPDDLLHHITDKLVPFRDYIRFSVVCKLWRSAYVNGSLNHFLRHQHQFPLLLLPTELNQDGQTRTLYNIVEKRSCNSLVQLPHSKFCVGSSHGWLLIACENNDVYLLNPFLSPPANQIHLPSLLTFPHEYDNNLFMVELFRVTLSHNPTLNPNDFLVLVTYTATRYVAFCKPGDKVWTQLYKTGSIDCSLYYRDRFYFVNALGWLFTSDLDPRPHPPVLSEILLQTPECNCADLKYLVELCGELFIVIRYKNFNKTVRFVVYKVDLDELRLRKVKSLGSYAVFVGLNSAFSVSALEFPGCKHNSIYFTDDYIEFYWKRILYGTGRGPQDFGVFSLDDGKIEQYYPMESDMIFPPPVWVEPSLRYISTTAKPVLPILQSIVGVGTVILDL